MYKIYGFFPKIRCLCGREHLALRALVCPCGATLRVISAGHKRKRPFAIITEPRYKLADQPFKEPAMEWVE